MVFNGFLIAFHGFLGAFRRGRAAEAGFGDRGGLRDGLEEVVEGCLRWDLPQGRLTRRAAKAKIHGAGRLRVSFGVLSLRSGAFRL